MTITSGISNTSSENGNRSQNRPELEQLLELLRVFHSIDSEFPLQYMICMIEIAREEGISLTTLAERTNLSLSTISRIVGALSNYRQNGQPFGLVEIKISETERRRKELAMTPKGRAILNKALKLLNVTN